MPRKLLPLWVYECLECGEVTFWIREQLEAAMPDCPCCTRTLIQEGYKGTIAFQPAKPETKPDADTEA
jgi:predicted nucleic acid-binding Zn ribbon protein